MATVSPYKPPFWLAQIRRISAWERSLVSTKCRRPPEAVSQAARAQRARSRSPALQPVAGSVHGSTQNGVSAPASVPAISASAPQILNPLTLGRSFFICKCPHHILELGHAAAQIVHCLRFRVRQFSMFEGVFLGVVAHASAHHPAGDAD